MTKTSGICTVLKEDGGTASPGESKEGEVSIGEEEERVGSRNVQPLNFLICTSRTTRRVSLCTFRYSTTTLTDSPSYKFIELPGPLEMYRVSSTRKLYQLSLRHVCLNEPASLRMY